MTLNAAIAQQHLDGLAKPQGSLGRLEELAIAFAVTQQSLKPSTNPRRIVLFAGDHGVVESGVSAWPSAVTTTMMETILDGKATCAAFARAQNVDLRLIDTGSRIPPQSNTNVTNFRDARIAAGTENLALGPAMTEDQFHAAWAIGETEAQRANEEGYVLLLAGEMGIGNTTPAACLTMLLAGADVQIATGRGAGADDNMRKHKEKIVAQATKRARQSFENNPVAAMAEISGFEIVAMAGFYAQAAKLGATILLDGYVTTAAALIAERLAPGTAERMIAAHLSAEPGHRLALEHLKLKPLLEWEMRLGEGTGALTALPLLDNAAALLKDVASLADILP